MSRKTSRIVVGFDATHGEPLVEAAVRLAQALEAEVLGVFVEELEALHLASLPFAAFIGHSGRREQLDPERLSALLRAAAERAEQRLSAAAERGRVPSSFRVARGRFLRELEQAAQRDLILVGSARPTPAATEHGLVAVAVSDAQGAERLLELGAAIAGRGDEPVAVLVPRQGAAREVAERWAANSRRGAMVVPLEAFEPSRIAAALGRVGGRLLVAAAGSPWLGEPELRELRRELRCPLVIAR